MMFCLQHPILPSFGNIVLLIGKYTSKISIPTLINGFCSFIFYFYFVTNREHGKVYSYFQSRHRVHVSIIIVKFMLFFSQKKKFHNKYMNYLISRAVMFSKCSYQNPWSHNSKDEGNPLGNS